MRHQILTVDDPEFEKVMHRKRLWNEYTLEERTQMAGSRALTRQWTKYNRAVNRELERILGRKK